MNGRVTGTYWGRADLNFPRGRKYVSNAQMDKMLILTGGGKMKFIVPT